MWCFYFLFAENLNDGKNVEYYIQFTWYKRWGQSNTSGENCFNYLFTFRCPQGVKLTLTIRFSESHSDCSVHTATSWQFLTSYRSRSLCAGRAANKVNNNTLTSQSTLGLPVFAKNYCKIYFGIFFQADASKALREAFEGLDKLVLLFKKGTHVLGDKVGLADEHFKLSLAVIFFQ